MYVAVPPDLDEVIERSDPKRLLELIRRGMLGPGESEDGRDYVHWDKLRHLEPPDDLTHEEWWFTIRTARAPLFRPFPLKDPEGRPFVYAVSDLVLRRLHHVDQRCSGEIAMPKVVTADEQARQHYLVNSLMEEAIRSSQLEGATTSRRVAKELLRSGREPRDRSEQMILNNYRALQFIREGIGDKLTPEAVLELHRIVTQDTLDDPDTAGRLQRPDEERVAVYDRADGSLVHAPPPAEQLPDRLQAMCDFANEWDRPERFVHPVVRAVLLHFWMGYDHPFEDGNGRTARALFYWYMRARGYWLVEYLSISEILRKAPAQYTRAFLLTETDNRDATYFIVNQLGVIERAVDELHAYLHRKVQEVRDVERLVKSSPDFNHRQLALLGYALRTPESFFTFQSHATSHGVTHETARNDLLPLVDGGLLEQRRSGRRYVFRPAPDLTSRLKHVGHQTEDAGNRV
jgi:Fic family protein